MLEPYRMVFVNVIASCLVLMGTITYGYIYPKKKINLFVLLVIISILPIISIFRAGDYQSGDFNIHIYRSMAFYKSLTEGHIMPSWAGDLNSTYGYPLFMFNYTLPYYLISFFHFLGFSFIASMKIFLALNFVLSGIFLYALGKNIFKNELTAFTSAIFYLFIPYHLISLHFKVTIGEILSFTILPLIFIFIQKFFVKNSKFYLLLSGFFFGLLMLSHAAVGIFSIPVIFTYFILLAKKINLKIIVNALLIFTVGLTISLYNWASPFIYKQYMFIQVVHVKMPYFPNILELLYSPWRMGFLFQGPRGEISDLIGYTQILIIILTIYFLFKKRFSVKNKTFVAFWLLMSIAIIFMVSSFSKPIWSILPLIKIVGSQRLMVILSLTIALTVGYLTQFLKNRFYIYALIFVTIAYTILNWGQRRVIPQINDAVLTANLPHSTSQGEAHFYANTRWVDLKHPWFSKIPKNHIEILNGKARIEYLQRLSTKHLYSINALTHVNIKENTLYFPGWQVTSNKKPVPINIGDRGVITFKLNQGIQSVRVQYKDIPIYNLTKIISLFTFILTLISIAYFILKNKLFLNP